MIHREYITNVGSNSRLAMLIVVLFVLTFSGLCGCAADLSEVNQKSQSEDMIADECMNQILEAIANKDSEALQNLFSKEALEAIDLTLMKTATKELFELFRGEVLEYDGELSTSTNNHTNEHTHQITGFYSIESTEGTYHLLFIFKDRDDENADAIGLSMILFVSDELFNSDGFYWNYGSRDPGIYIDQ